jgi:uncharacterized membrane protein
MMLEGYRHWLTLTAIGGTGLVGGVFFAYSTFTMSGIRRLPGTDGLRTMQQINRAADSSAPLVLALFGTGSICILLGIGAVRDIHTPTSALHLAAGLLYIVGALGLTIAFHVPRNNALQLTDPTAPGAMDKWQHYATVWTAGNHVRTIASLASAVIYAMSLRASTS